MNRIILLISILLIIFAFSCSYTEYCHRKTQPIICQGLADDVYIAADVLYDKNLSADERISLFLQRINTIIGPLQQEKGMQ